jgi:hypothetical protein
MHLLNSHHTAFALDWPVDAEIPHRPVLTMGAQKISLKSSSSIIS